MAEVKSVSVKISADGYEDAKLKIDRLTVASDELARKNPEITPQIDSAKALIEARLLKDGIKKELSGSVMADAEGGGGSGGSGGLFSSLFGGGSSAGESGLSGGAPMIAGIAGAVVALLPELSALVSGFTAAGAGVGAFGALALPTFDKIKNAYAGIQTAVTNYNNAAALEKADPTKANAKAAADALIKMKMAEDNLSPSTKTAVAGLETLIGTYKAMALAFAPDAMKVFNSALKVANTLLPDLKPFATIAAGAIDGLLGKVNKFFQSADFKKWLGTFSQYVGPSITAIGTGIGKVVVALGKLLTGMSVKDVVHGITGAFDFLAGAIDAVTGTVQGLMKAYDWFSTQTEVASGRVLKFFSFVLSGVEYFTDAVLGAFKMIVDGAASAFGWIPGLGPKLKTAQKYFDNFYDSVHNNLSTAQKNLDQWSQDMLNAPKKFKIEGDITDLQTKLATAEKDLKNPDLTKTRKASIEADISQLEAEIAAAKARLNALNGYTVTTYVNTVGRSSGMPRAASGGYRSGVTLVGELGPEIVDLPHGSYVHTAAESRGMMSGGGAHYTINVNTLVADRNTGRMVVEAIKTFEQGSGKSWRAA